MVVVVLLAGCAGARDEVDAAPGPPGAPPPARHAEPQPGAGADRAAGLAGADAFGRAAELWAEANRLARSGVVLPVELARNVAVMRFHQADGTTPPPGLREEIERHRRELAIKSGDPGAIGPIAIAVVAGAPAGEPVRAGSWVTIEQTYTVGSLRLEPGAVVLLGKQLMADQWALQNVDPAADGYVTLRVERGDAVFEPTQVPLAGMHGGFGAGAAPMPAFVLSRGGLAVGDRLTVGYGDRSRGSRGFQIQSFETDELVLPLYLDFDGSGHFFTPRWPSIEVVGNAAAGIEVIAPSAVAPGEEFSLVVRAEDTLHNRATAGVPALTVSLRGRVVATLPGGGEAIRTVSGLSVDRTGVYRYEVRSADGRFSTRSNPVKAMEGPHPRILWGETHGHTGMAEGQGSPAGYYRFAREDARLDFATLSEHDLYLDDAEWEAMRALARSETVTGRFVAFLGYEWTAPHERGGHHNVLFRSPDHERVPVQSADRPELLYQGLRTEAAPDDVLVIPHAHQAADWTLSDGVVERMVEIVSTHGTFEWFGNRYLENGFRVGFAGASDDHRSRPGHAHGMSRTPLIQEGGLTAVLAADATPEAIFAALRGLSAYATSGPRFVVEATLNGYPMGSRQPATAERRLAVAVSGTAPIDHIEVIKNGVVIANRSFLAAPLGRRTLLQLGFQSSSEVFGGRDNPRPHRVWRGRLEIAGGRLVAARGVGLDNPFLDRVAVSDEEPDVLRFDLLTRGRGDVVLLDLEEATPDTELRFALEATREFGVAPRLLLRPPADIQAQSFVVRLGDLASGPVEHRLPVGPHLDLVRLQLVDPDAPLDRDFELTDLAAVPGSDDYYYLRVTQLDGGRAWTSPFWVEAPGRARRDD